METKKLGFLILGISIVAGFLMFGYMNKVSLQGEQLHCNPTQECQQVSSLLGVSHIAVGFLAFIFALGFYLLFFNKDERQILQKYKEEIAKLSMEAKKPKEQNDKFALLLRPLDDNEKKVMLAIKEQEGITQSTLSFRTNLSKAKISQILTDFEKKSMVERKAKGKTYSVFLNENF